MISCGPDLLNCPLYTMQYYRVSGLIDLTVYRNPLKIYQKISYFLPKIKEIDIRLIKLSLNISSTSNSTISPEN